MPHSGAGVMAVGVAEGVGARTKLENSLVFGTVEAVFSVGEYFVLVILCPTLAGLVLSLLDNPPSYPLVVRSVPSPACTACSVSDGSNVKLTLQCALCSVGFQTSREPKGSELCGSGHKRSVVSCQGQIPPPPGISPQPSGADQTSRGSALAPISDAFVLVLHAVLATLACLAVTGWMVYRCVRASQRKLRSLPQWSVESSFRTYGWGGAGDTNA
jgi:hypothetical protein